MRSERVSRLGALRKVWQLSFALVLLSFVLVLLGSILAPEQPVVLSAGPAVKVLFFAGFALCALLVINGFFFWISMIVFALSLDSRKIGAKALWLLIITFGLSYGAAAYYWFSARALMREKP